VNGTIYYATYTESRYEGALTDVQKIAGGVNSLVKSFPQGQSETSNQIDNFVNVNGTLYFTAQDEAGGYEVWKTNGTPAGTLQLPELNPGPGSSDPVGLFNVGNVLYFTSAYNTSSSVLYKYDLNQPVATAVRINAGGPAHTVTVYGEFGGYPTDFFGADAYFTGGTAFASEYSSDNYIENVYDGKLYLSERWGTFSYNVPVLKGRYQVVLHFAEIYWGKRNLNGGAGSRKFNVDMEGSRKLTEYDIFTKAGGAMRAIKETFQLDVTDGTLNIAFLKGTADNPKVSAIEVIPMPAPTPTTAFYRAINLNGDAITLDGNSWAGKTATNYNTNGSSFVNTTTALVPSTDATRTAMIRSSVWRYTGLQLNLTSVPSGTYQVYLYVWEDNNTETYSITLEGRVVQPNYYSGSPGTWKKLGPYQAAITDGTISIATTGGAANFSGVEVWRVNTTAAAAARVATATETDLEAFSVKLYPNPVQNRLSVKLPFAASQVRGTSVTDAAGNARLLDAHSVVALDELEVRTEGLQQGFYLLKLDTEQGFKVVKFIKQ
jgi:ELWxxDGT repeat protein